MLAGIPARVKVRLVGQGVGHLTTQNHDGALARHATSVLVKRLLRDSVRPYAGLITAALGCMAVMAGATALSAWLMKPVVNKVFVEKNMDMLWLISGAIIATFLVKGVANYAQSTLMSHVGLKIINDNQNRLYAHLLGMDVGFFQRHQTGRLISRFTVDITNMRVAVSNGLTGFGKDALSLIGLVAVMFTQNWELAVIAFFVFPVAIYPIVRLGKRMRKVTANTQEETGLFMALLEETFQGVRVVKAYGMETYERARVNGIIERIFHLTMKAARTRAASSPIMETLGGLAVAAVIVYGGHQVIADKTDAGSFFSFITALLMAYEPMKRLANLNASLQEGLAGAARLFDMLDVAPAIIEKPNAAPLTVGAGEVTLQDVRFAYDDESTALAGLNLTVPAGKTAALVGPSGAGKTTVLNLIPRFFDVQSGTVAIDGQDVRGVTFASLRGAIALVSQEVTLFDDTVRANIAYGRAGASDDDIVAAAKAAAAHDFIEGLPQGYDTVVGEKGLRLSGGQRQRLSIARAMLKNAPILLLDEATSALDTESERHVQEALKHLMMDRTTLVIAHRLSTVMDADVIYVVDKGRVAEHGNHAELLARGGLYAKLYDMQFAEDDAAPIAAGA